MKLKTFNFTAILATTLCLSSLYLAGDYSLEPPITLSFYHRFRVESFDNAINLNEQIADGFNYTRHKSSFGVLWKSSEQLEFFGKVSNEFRIYLAPKGRKANNEIFIDNLYVKWKQESVIPFTLTVGRQDIHLGEGFVVMDGQASAGSRSFYFNALRLDLTPWENHQFTLYYGYVPRTDNFLPVIKLTRGDDQILEEQSYTSMGTYYAGVFPFAKIEAYFIRKDTRKNEFFPSEFHFNTIGTRIVGRFSDVLTLTGEAALQRGNIKETALTGEPSRDMASFGGHAHLDYSFPEGLVFFRTITFGGIFLSGDDPTTSDCIEAWDPVHSRWPKWSESYIYTLLPENRVAYWSNLNSIYLTLSGKIMDNLTAMISYYTLGAQHTTPEMTFPGGTGKNRGNLAIVQLLMTFSKNLTGHILWEHFLPGDFYFPEASDYNWLRFEMLLKL